MGGVVGRRIACAQSLAAVGDSPGDGLCRGRRTVTTLAAGRRHPPRLLRLLLLPAALGRKSKSQAQRLFMLLLMKLETGPRLLLAVDDSPTKRYGPQVAGRRHSSQPDAGPGRSTLSLRPCVGHDRRWLLRHPVWQTIGLPLLGLLYVRAKDVAKIPGQARLGIPHQVGVGGRVAGRFAELAKAAGKTVWVVVDGGYAKRPFLRPLRAMGVTVVSRLRKDAALRTLPTQSPTRESGAGRESTATSEFTSPAVPAHPAGWQPLECLVVRQSGS